MTIAVRMSYARKPLDAKPDKKVFRADRLRRLREEMKLSQDRLAKAVDIEKRSIIRYEQGQREPAADVLVRLAKVLQTSTSYLLDEFDYDGPLTNEEADALRSLHSTGRPLTEADILRTLAKKRRKE